METEIELSSIMSEDGIATLEQKYGVNNLKCTMLYCDFNTNTGAVKIPISVLVNFADDEEDIKNNPELKAYLINHVEELVRYKDPALIEELNPQFSY